MQAPPLRPLGIGDIVDRVFALYRSRPLMFFALAAPPYLVLTLVFVGVLATRSGSLNEVSSGLVAGRAVDPAALADLTSTLITLTIVGGLAALLLISVQSASLVDAMSARYLGRTNTLVGSLVAGSRATPRLIGAGIVVFAALVAVWVVVAVVAALANLWLVAVAAVLLGLFATFYLTASSLVIPIVVTLEGAGPIAALRRSFRLTRGNRLRIVGLQLLLVVLNLVISTLLSAVLVGSFIGDATLRGGIQTIVNTIATIAWAPVEWGTFTVLYYDLRVRHEAFDLQVAAEALPREP